MNYLLSLMPKCVTNYSKGDAHHSLESLSRHAHRVSSFNIIFGVVTLMSVLGNFLRCVAICQFSRLKTYNILVFSLAMIDMLTGLYKNMAQVSFIHPALSWKTEGYFSNKNMGPSSGALPTFFLFQLPLQIFSAFFPYIYVYIDTT